MSRRPGDDPRRSDTRAQELTTTIRASAHALLRDIIPFLGGREDGWRDPLDEIESTYDYNAWDLAAVSVFTTLLHHGSGLPGLLREQSTKQGRQVRKAITDLERWRRKYMNGRLPLFRRLSLEENLPTFEGAPSPETLSHRPAEWVLDEFAGHVGVILGQVRVEAMPEPPTTPDEALDLAFDLGESLLKRIAAVPFRGGRLRAKLRRRFDHLHRRGDLPPAPDDRDPTAWLTTIQTRFLRRPEARVALQMLSRPAGLRRVRRRLNFIPGQRGPEVEALSLDSPFEALPLLNVPPARIVR